jgi:hypothetical protein
LNCDELYPAIWKALVRYGASKSTYRVEEVVSGRMTPTRPLPAEVTLVSCDIAEKLLSNDEMLRDGVAAVVGDVEPDGAAVVGAVVLLVLLQAPAIKPVPMASTNAARVVFKMLSPLSGPFRTPPTGRWADLLLRSPPGP